MQSLLVKIVRRHPFLAAAVAALFMLLTGAAAWLWAHAGHEVLPVRGVTVDHKRGLVRLEREVRDALDIQTAEVRSQGLEERLSAPALLVAPWQRHAYAASRLGGKIVHVHAQPGQVVRQGQVLAEVESLELETLFGELRTARQELRLASEALQDVEAASSRGSVSDQTLLTAQARRQELLDAEDIARRKLLGLELPESALEPDSRRPHTLPVLSPLDGTVIHADVQVGQVLAPTDHLFEIVDLSRVWVQVAVLEKDLPRIEVGQSLELRRRSQDMPAEPWSGTVQVAGVALDPQTLQGQVWGELVNPPGRPPRWLPGMAGQAEIVLPARAKTMTVPASALVATGADRYVFVQQADGQYARQNVVTGREALQTVEILEGAIYPGDRVVTTGSHELSALFEKHVLQLSPEAVRNAGLRVERAGKRNVAEVVEVNGVVDLPPDRRASVASPLAGRVQQLHVERTERVRAGDVVAEVASLEFQDLQVELLRSHLQHELHAGHLKRLRNLARPGVAAVSRQVVRDTEAAAQAAAVRRDTLRRKLEAAGLTAEQVQDITSKRRLLAALPVRAPIAGIVVRFQAALGQTIKAEDPLFEIHDLKGVQVRGHVAERQVRQVRLGQRARVRLAAVPDFVGEAVVVRSGQTFGSDRTLPLWAEWRGPHPEVLQGMLARLSLIVSEPKAVLAVPRAALWREGTRAYLFVRDDGIFSRREVRTGRGDDRFVEITAGLREGEEVTVQGVAGLQTAFASLK
jgi:cobalt-zinc-cadmium efflux system membrane fusion protein